MISWIFERAHRLRRSLRSPRPLAVALWLCLTTTSCAYFNTFYHAKSFYGQGEKARASERGQVSSNSTSSNFYKQAITKCEKVIQKYPGSKWEDDAYLMLGKSHYWRGDYLSAQDALSRLLTLKKTDLRDQGLFWQGRTSLAQENYSEAQAVWQTLLQEYPKFKHREEVEYYKAQATWDAGDPEGAIGAYQALLKRYPKGDHAAPARLDLGRLLVDERRYEEAEQVFSYVAQKGKIEEDRIEAKLQLGDVLEKQARHQEALKLYTDLEVSLDASARKNRMSWEDRQALELAEQERLEQAFQDSLRQAALDAQMNGDPMAGLDPNDPQNQLPDPNFPGTNPSQSTIQRRTQTNQVRRDVNDPRQKNLAQVLIREGCVLANLEKTEEALSAFQQVVAEYPQTPYAAEAQYRIGYTYEVHMEQFDRAQLAYDAVERQGNSSFRDDAVRRSKNLVALKTLMATAAKDSLSLAKSAAAESRFMKAELYLFQQENVERAIEEYTSIEKEFKGSEHAAKAGLALGWIAEHEQGDSAAARTKYAEVASQYPDTEYGRRAHAAVYGPEPEPQPMDFAGPSLAELITPENQQAAWLQAGGDSVLQAGGDSLQAPAPNLAGTGESPPNASPTSVDTQLSPADAQVAGTNAGLPGGSGTTGTPSGVLPGIGIAGAQASAHDGNTLPDSLLIAGGPSNPSDTTVVASSPDGQSVAATSPAETSVPSPNQTANGPSVPSPSLSSAGSTGATTSVAGGTVAGATSGASAGAGVAGAGVVGAGVVGAAASTLSDMVKATRQPPAPAVEALPDSTVATQPDSTSIVPPDTTRTQMNTPATQVGATSATGSQVGASGASPTQPSGTGVTPTEAGPPSVIPTEAGPPSVIPIETGPPSVSPAQTGPSTTPQTVANPSQTGTPSSQTGANALGVTPQTGANAQGVTPQTGATPQSSGSSPGTDSSSSPKVTAPTTAPIVLPGGLYLDPMALPADGPSPVSPPRRPRPKEVVPSKDSSAPAGKASKSSATSGKNSSKNKSSSSKTAKKGASPDSTSGTGSR